MAKTYILTKKDKDNEYDIQEWKDEKPPMMKCGHSANSFWTNLPGHEGKNIHTCVICDADGRIAVGVPDLRGRLAKCGCGNTRESNMGLAFFEYKGPDSTAASRICKKCSYTHYAHLPLWKYELSIRRDWFKLKNITTKENRQEHMPDKKTMDTFLQQRIKQLIKNSKTPVYGPDRPESLSEIFEIRIVSIDGPLPSGAGHEFEKHGPYKYDSYYCGCNGWD